MTVFIDEKVVNNF